MPTVDVFNLAGEKVSQVILSESIFGGVVKPHLLHDAVVWQLSNRRLATAKTKTRSEISGGGTKPWKQKGTGRARSGTNRSPLWRKGGVTFGPNGRTYKQNLPKKVREEALKSALSMKIGETVLKVVDKIIFDEIKTKNYIKTLEKLGMNNVLVVTGTMTPEASLISRNHATSKVLDVRGLNVYDILKYKGLVLDLDAVKIIEERLS
jgi:large subunit ribosomal protein L4